jgi:hypothetical protein
MRFDEIFSVVFLKPNSFSEIVAIQNFALRCTSTAVRHQLSDYFLSISPFLGG